MHSRVYLGVHAKAQRLVQLEIALEQVQRFLRSLTSSEARVLIRNDVSCDGWNLVL